MTSLEMQLKKDVEKLKATIAEKDAKIAELSVQKTNLTKQVEDYDKALRIERAENAFHSNVIAKIAQ